MALLLLLRPLPQRLPLASLQERARTMLAQLAQSLVAPAAAPAPAPFRWQADASCTLAQHEGSVVAGRQQGLPNGPPPLLAAQALAG